MFGGNVSFVCYFLFSLFFLFFPSPPVALESSGSDVPRLMMIDFEQWKEGEEIGKRGDGNREVCGG